MNVFILFHVRESSTGEDVKTCGIFSTKDNAERAKNSLSNQPGFSEQPDNFYIDEYQLDRVFWEEGFGIRC